MSGDAIVTSDPMTDDATRVVVGLSCDYHDAAACVLVDGVIVAAAEEERFSRVKHDARFPAAALDACLEVAGLDATDVDVVVFHEKPLTALARYQSASRRRGPRAIPGFIRDVPTFLRTNLMIRNRIERWFEQRGRTDPPSVVYSEHHLSHAAAAFLPSPFERAAILTVDGLGEWSTASIAHGVGRRIDLLMEMRFPNSLGLAYSLGTTWCGFESNEGEYKMMGLAPFGEPVHLNALRELFAIDDDGSVRVDARRLRWWGGRPDRLRAVRQALGCDPRPPEQPITDQYADVAASFQALAEQALVRMAAHARRTTGERRLCLAGGVALNCVANSVMLEQGAFDDIWVQPAAGDSGSAVGAALWWWFDQLGHDRHEPTPPDRHDSQRTLAVDAMSGAALGPAADLDDIDAAISDAGLSARIVDDAARADEVAAALADGRVVGWFVGRMEFGPRALGHRSILADPRRDDVLADLNQRVKGREDFRPFAPAVLWEHADAWFDLDRPSPYMLFTHQVAASQLVEVATEPTSLGDRAAAVRSTIPACTHVDHSARVQTVHRELHPEFHALLERFHDITGCPVVLNTSFNLAGEPIVCSPADAIRSATAGGIDLLVLEDRIVELERP